MVWRNTPIFGCDTLTAMPRMPWFLLLTLAICETFRVALYVASDRLQVASTGKGR